ncbi:AraC family transcriptional regulator [Acinetobacter haemolyticus]|uniref:AraC family transcriptional regulator n=1 Tax=Acinetobacter haemolyticus TaxID=29430 RepID=UPI001372452D|nr:helix-turn-helix transcriptional regulator [Acinetobacter haemolyticus]NAR19566.1 helix-turn-helix domain-containing protein [Acinetobacter haemolyticus]NAR37496.1 helix-turn-helix domain-containing protein [Acinetobacter haemolyticus]NAS09899.1 helix-turn-helix domain-containing protein [Acinetobacter haemolyticus]
MKKTAQRIQDFQKIPTIKDIPAPLWLRVRDAPAETIYPEHAHAWGEFIYAFDGVLEVSIEQIHYLTPPPYGIWLPPHMQHSGINRNDVTYSSLYVHESLCQQMPQQAGILLTAPLVPALLEHIRKHPFSEQDPEYLRLLQVLLDALTHAELVGSYLPTTQHPALSKILSHLHAYPADNSTLQQLAEMINMTERTLARYSQKELGMSLHEWRQRLKVMKAMSMLNQGKTIENIALDLGYASSSDFIYMFKRWMHFTPDQFRKLYQGSG